MGKVAVVTGGTKGIGKAISKRYIDEGFRVLVCSRNEKNFQSLKEGLGKDQQEQISFFAANLGVQEEAEAFGDWVLKKSDTVDVLVNNAGIFFPGAIHQEPDGTLENLMNNNLYSAYWLSRKIIPSMIEKKGGHIFNMCSTASIIPYDNGGAYCISKFALLALSKLLRVELMEHNIKVTAILPGATWTDSWSSSGIDQDRFIKPDDIAELVFATSNLSPSANVEELLVRPQQGDV